MGENFKNKHNFVNSFLSMMMLFTKIILPEYKRNPLDG